MKPFCTHRMATETNGVWQCPEPGCRATWKAERRDGFKSERHHALSSTFPPDLAKLTSSGAIEAPPPKRSRAWLWAAVITLLAIACGVVITLNR